MTYKLKPHGTEHLKLKRDILLSTAAFKFNLRRYIKVNHVSSSSSFATCISFQQHLLLNVARGAKAKA